MEGRQLLHKREGGGRRRLWRVVDGHSSYGPQAGEVRQVAAGGLAGVVRVEVPVPVALINMVAGLLVEMVIWVLIQISCVSVVGVVLKPWIGEGEVKVGVVVRWF